jgi:hypothetical protein
VKEVHPIYPKHIRDDIVSYDHVIGYIITTPHFEDYKYGNYYYVIIQSHNLIVNSLSLHFKSFKELIP